jgi:hypothetical protein
MTMLTSRLWLILFAALTEKAMRVIPQLVIATLLTLVWTGCNAENASRESAREDTEPVNATARKDSVRLVNSMSQQVSESVGVYSQGDSARIYVSGVLVDGRGFVTDDETAFANRPEAAEWLRKHDFECDDTGKAEGMEVRTTSGHEKAMGWLLCSRDQ